MMSQTNDSSEQLPAAREGEFETRHELPEDLSRRLRISLTASCNFACFFCHNEGQVARPERSASFSISDYTAIVRSAAEAGITKVKLTGGEPLIYRDGSRTIVDLVAALAGLKSEFSLELSMTTNGSLLDRFATDLREAGLDRLTLSLHSSSEASFAAYVAKVPSARYFSPEIAFQAIERAKFTNTKVNTVLFGDERSGSVRELPELVALAERFDATEHRLYTVIDGSRLGIARQMIRFWDDGLAKQVSEVLLPGSPLATSFAERLEEFSRRGAALGSARRETLVARARGRNYVFDAIRPDRFGSSAMSDEGPYSVRLSADGTVSAFLSEATDQINIGLHGAARTLPSRTAMRAAFAAARTSLCRSESLL